LLGFGSCHPSFHYLSVEEFGKQVRGLIPCALGSVLPRPTIVGLR
jgi:hypothetical protein